MPDHSGKHKTHWNLQRDWWAELTSWIHRIDFCTIRADAAPGAIFPHMLLAITVIVITDAAAILLRVAVLLLFLLNKLRVKSPIMAHIPVMAH